MGEWIMYFCSGIFGAVFIIGLIFFGYLAGVSVVCQ